MNNNHTDPRDGLQLQLFRLAEVDNVTFIDPLDGWNLIDVRALAIDPDVEMRRIAALSNWNCDIRLQRVLASDPDESVVVNMLTRIDPPLEVLCTIFAGPHVHARRLLAARNLPTSLLVQLADDCDDEVRRSVICTLRRRGVLDDMTATSR